ncbi:MAG: hypothetical protein JWL83_4070 [Actinomycetia bacterium]|nr:hypothetical protein [Actinomycetes bacterium]
MAPPPVQIIEGCFGALDHAALVALCRLDVPDRLTNVTPVSDLARDLAADPDALERLLRYAAARGWVRFGRRGAVRPAPVLRFLRRDHPGGWRAWVEFTGGADVTGAMAHIAEAVSAGQDPFVVANGAPFFAWMTANPGRQQAFDAAMAAGGRMHGLVLAETLPWASSAVVCDVGGGDGALLGVLLDRHPHLRGVLFDLPSVVARAPGHARLHVAPGDAFVSVPEACDTYLLVSVLHDWSDNDARRLLERVVAAAAPGARIVVVEGERKQVPADDITARTDLLMLALTPGGRERTTGEFAALGAAVGLRHERAVALASGNRAHVFRR